MLFVFTDPKSSGFLRKQVKVSGVRAMALGGDRRFGSSVCWSRLRGGEVSLCRDTWLWPLLSWDPLQRHSEGLCGVHGMTRAGL